MSEVRRWLDAIGLAQYADAFEAKRVGEESVYVLPGAIEVLYEGAIAGKDLTTRG
jgi:hypothetical protein